MKGFGCHVWEPGIEPAGTREPLSFSAGMSMIGARMCPEHREGLLPSHWSRSSWKAQGSFLSGVTAGSTLTLHMLAPSHPAGLTRDEAWRASSGARLPGSDPGSTA